MRVSKRAMAAAAIGLIALIVAGLFIARRGDSSTLLARRDQLVRDLEREFREAVAASEALPEDVRHRLDVMSTGTGSVAGRLTSLRSDTETLLGRRESMSARLRRLEQLRSQQRDIAADQQHLRDLQSIWTRAVHLPDGLSEIAGRLPNAGSMASRWDFASFIEEMRNLGILPVEMDGLPEDLKTDLRNLFELFSINMTLLKARQITLVDELATRAIEAEEYIDIPLDADEREFPELWAGSPGLSLTRRYDDLGVKRHFNFPFDEYPQWVQFQEAGENAMRHLLYETSQLAIDFERRSFHGNPR